MSADVHLGHLHPHLAQEESQIVKMMISAVHHDILPLAPEEPQTIKMTVTSTWNQLHQLFSHNIEIEVTAQIQKISTMKTEHAGEHTEDLCLHQKSPPSPQVKGHLTKQQVRDLLTKQRGLKEVVQCHIQIQSSLA